MVAFLVMSAASTPARSRLYWGVAMAIVLISALQIGLLYVFGAGSLLDRVAAHGALVGAYGLGLGFLDRSGRLARFGGVKEAMTDPEPLAFVRGNLYLCAQVAYLASLGVGGGVEPGAPRRLTLLGQLLWLPAALVVIAFLLLHLLVFMFLAYLPMVLAAALVARVAHTSQDIEFSLGEDTFRLKEVVRADEQSFTLFFMGIPGVSLAVGGTLLEVFAGGF